MDLELGMEQRGHADVVLQHAQEATKNPSRELAKQLEETDVNERATEGDRKSCIPHGSCVWRHCRSDGAKC